jgi:hypothetical protein
MEKREKIKIMKAIRSRSFMIGFTGAAAGIWFRRKI